MIEVKRCSCPHLVFKGKNLEKFNNNEVDVLVDGKHYTLKKIKSGKNYIKFENIINFPLGKKEIELYIPPKYQVTGGCNCGVLIR